MKQISFIIPVYNTPLDQLQACIASIISIEHCDYEIVVINDGSAQSLRELYDGYFAALNKPQIKCIYQVNRGVSAARNIGLSAATGKYVMFVDADDTIIAGTLDRAYDADIILFDYLRTKGQKKSRLVPLRDHPNGNVPWQELVWQMIQGQTRTCRHLYRREFLTDNQICFEEGCIHGEDTKFNFHCAVSHPTVEYVKQPLYCYNFSSQTVLSRWKRAPELMIKSEAECYAQYISCLPNVFPSDAEQRKKILAVRRVGDIFRNGMELCCAGQATENNRAEIERLMAQIQLPPTTDRKTRNCYNMILKRRWGCLTVVAKLRLLYLKLTGI